MTAEQAGFWQYRSTEDQTTHLAQVIKDAFQAKKVVLASFIDLQKAFDKIWKDGLVVKLLRLGIRGNMLRWTKSYLHNRRARALVNGNKSRKVLLRQGVPQGGVLSPILLILFINDVVKELPKGVRAALYADDLVLWTTECKLLWIRLVHGLRNGVSKSIKTNRLQLCSPFPNRNLYHSILVAYHYNIRMSKCI